MPIQRPKLLRSSTAAAHGDCLTCSRGTQVWRVRVRRDGLVVGAAAVDWFSLEHHAQAERVKAGHARICWRVVVGEAVVFAKVYEAAGVAGRLMHRLTGTPVEREWHALLAAEQRGVPVVQAIAAGVCSASGRSVLLTSAFEPSMPFARFWEEAAADASDRRRASARQGRAVAELLATAHARGVVHRDGHPSNILVRPDESAHPPAVFVDLLGAKLGAAPASRALFIRSIAQLDQCFHRRATHGERLRFLKRCLAAHADSNAPTDVWRPVVAEVLAARARWACRLARRRDRRLRRRGKYFTRLSLGGGWTGVVALELERRHVFLESHVPDRSASQWADILSPLVLAAGGSPDRAVAIDSDDVRVDLRAAGGLSERIVWGILGSPARRAFERAHRARHRDLPGELMLGYIEHHWFGLIDRTVLLRSVPAAEATPSSETDHEGAARHG